MKKFILSIILFMMFIPVIANAKEYCTVVSGNGKDIGSEIACGTENFYIIGNNESSIRLIAKYNLDIGYEYNKVVMSQDRYEQLDDLYNISSWNRDFDGLKTQSEFSNYDGIQSCNVEQYSCMAYKYIHSEVIKQSSKAVGAHGNTSGEPLFPEYGVVRLETPGSNSGTPYGGGYYADLDMTNFRLHYYYDNEYYLTDYLDYLERNNIEANSIDIISVKELDEIINRISNKSLPLEEWWTRGWNSVDGNYGNNYWVVGNFKEYLPEGYEWLYNTTYWTKTTVPNTTPDGEYGYGIYVYFIDTLGNLCNADQCSISVGAGIRPIIDVNKDTIKYLIKTKTDGNGTIEVIDNASGGDSIQFKVSAKKGLKLAGLTITTDSGEKVEFNEEDITFDSSGVLSVSTNKFTMPYENVTIEARWTSNIINPNTGTGISVIIITTILVISSITYMVFKRKKNYIIK